MAQTMTPCNQDLEFWRSPNCFHLRLYLNYFPLSHCLVWVLSLMVGSAMNVRPWIALQYTKVLLQVHVMQRKEYEWQIGLTLLRHASSSAQSQTAATCVWGKIWSQRVGTAAVGYLKVLTVHFLRYPSLKVIRTDPPKRESKSGTLTNREARGKLSNSYCHMAVAMNLAAS